MEVRKKGNVLELNVRMLGACVMEYGGRSVLERKNQSSRTFHLLLILLYAGPDGIRRDHLIARLFGAGDKCDGAGNLRVVVYYLRKLLKESGLPGEPSVCLEEGCYRFRSSFPVNVDALVFDHLVKRAGLTSGRERMELLKKACGLYGGCFLPPLSGEDWVNAADARYQRQYRVCMEEVCQYLKEQGEYRELLEFCSRAASICPFDEWQVWQIDCLTALGRGEEAMVLYEKTVRRYFEELALGPSEQMLACLHRMEEKIRMDTESLQDIQEKLREREKPEGVYHCSYPGFVDSYRMLARILEQSGQPACLVLCGFTDHRKRHGEEMKNSSELSGILSEAIQEALGSGDVYTRYSRSQFLLILTGIAENACADIVGRIDAGFRRRVSSRKVQVAYRIAPINAFF